MGTDGLLPADESKNNKDGLDNGSTTGVQFRYSSETGGQGGLCAHERGTPEPVLRFPGLHRQICESQEGCEESQLLCILGAAKSAGLCLFSCSTE